MWSQLTLTTLYNMDSETLNLIAAKLVKQRSSYWEIIHEIEAHNALRVA